MKLMNQIPRGVLVSGWSPMQGILQIINVGKPLASERLATADVKEEVPGSRSRITELEFGVFGVFGGHIYNWRNSPLKDSTKPCQSALCCRSRPWLLILSVPSTACASLQRQSESWASLGVSSHSAKCIYG